MTGGIDRLHTKKGAGGGCPPPALGAVFSVRRYGTETLVLSPELLMVKVPADATGV
jgi:hypothetical protein